MMLMKYLYYGSVAIAAPLSGSSRHARAATAAACQAVGLHSASALWQQCQPLPGLSAVSGFVYVLRVFAAQAALMLF